MSSNNIYNILGKLKGITDTAALTPETPVEKIYESVEAKGDIMEAVRSLEEKYMGFKAVEKAAKKGGAEDPAAVAASIGRKKYGKKKFQKAAAAGKKLGEGEEYCDVCDSAKCHCEQVEESAKPDFLDVDKDGDKKEPMKKAAKDKNNAKGAFKDMFGGSAKDLTSKLKIKEGAGPYTLDDPKHPKFKANYEKFKKSNPDCKLADFVAAMKKKEKNLSEAAYDEPAPVDADAVAKRKRLQAIKDRQEDERAARGSDGANTPIRKVAGKAYGGAAQADEPNEFEKGNFIQRKKSINLGPNDDLDEVAPPGAKAERMVKHIKKGYSKDGALTKKEKGIAYATAWKAKKAGQVEEGCKFGDTIENSAPKMKKTKLAKLKESKVMEETDYFYEKVGKALSEKNPHLDTAGDEFYDAVRKEMVAQGIPPNRARNILLMDEDFLSDVATSYGHYCKEVAECGAPMNSHLGGVEELDEIAKLAGLTAPTREQAMGVERSNDLMDEVDMDIDNPDEYNRNFGDDNLDDDLYVDEADMEEGNAFTGKLAATPSGENFKLGNKSYKDTSAIEEADMAEGNEFSGALAAAKASGAKEFEVAGKRYTVKEDINVNITANGEEDALNLFRKLAGMAEVETSTAHEVELPHDAETAIAQGIVEPIEVEVDEERDIEYTNTPNEKIGPVDSAIPSGTDLNRSKTQYKKEYPGDNPMAVREDSNLWKKYTGMLKGLIK